MRIHTIVGLPLTTLLLTTSVAAGDKHGRDPIATTSHFAFYSDFDTNLNDALIVAGTARGDGKPELFQTGDEQACFQDLPPSAQFGWNLAVDYYAEVMAPAGWQGRQQSLLRHELAGLDREFVDRGRRFVDITTGFLAAAAPAYRTCRWPVQDAANQAWIDELLPRLDAHATNIAGRLAIHYATPLHGLPIRVDVISTALHTGANTIYLTPEGGHVLISSTVAPAESLEIIFHEASHTLMRHRDPVQVALKNAAEELGVEMPRDLWHAVLFYTTGQTVRRVLKDAGEGEYTPYVYSHNLWRGPWAPLRGPVEQTWPAYLAGESTLVEVAGELVHAIHQQRHE